MAFSEERRVGEFRIKEVTGSQTGFAVAEKTKVIDPAFEGTDGKIDFKNTQQQALVDQILSGGGITVNGALNYDKLKEVNAIITSKSSNLYILPRYKKDEYNKFTDEIDYATDKNGNIVYGVDKDGKTVPYVNYDYYYKYTVVVEKGKADNLIKFIPGEFEEKGGGHKGYKYGWFNPLSITESSLPDSTLQNNGYVVYQQSKQDEFSKIWMGSGAHQEILDQYQATEITEGDYSFSIYKPLPLGDLFTTSGEPNKYNSQMVKRLQEGLHQDNLDKIGTKLNDENLTPEIVKNRSTYLSN